MWEDIKGYEGIYQVSTTGRIRSLPRYILRRGRPVFISGKLIAIKYHRDGYVQSALWKNGKAKWFKVHRLVALTFLPNPESKEMVNHKDLNKGNNNLSNLEWVTRSENGQHYHKSKKRCK